MEKNHTQLQEGTESFASTTAKKIFGSVEIATLLTAAGFMIGYKYYKGYFDRLSVPFLSQQLDTADLLLVAIFPVLIWSAVLSISFINTASLPSKFDVFRENFFMLCAGLVASSVWLYHSDKLHFNLSASSIIGYTTTLILVFGYIYLSKKRKSFVCMWQSKLIFYRICIILWISFAMIVTSDTLGTIAAENTITGYRGVEIKITLNNNKEFLPNKHLILVASTADRYYVVERANPPPRNPEVYVVNNKDIAKVKLRHSSLSVPTQI